MTSKGRGIAQDDKLHARPGHGDIHPPEVPEETDLTIFICPYERDDDHIPFLPLEAIHGVDCDQAAVWLEERIRFILCLRY